MTWHRSSQANCLKIIVRWYPFFEYPFLVTVGSRLKDLSARHCAHNTFVYIRLYISYTFFLCSCCSFVVSISFDFARFCIASDLSTSNRVRFLLARHDECRAYRLLYAWIRVTKSEALTIYGLSVSCSLFLCRVRIEYIYIFECVFYVWLLFCFVLYVNIHFNTLCRYRFCCCCCWFSLSFIFFSFRLKRLFGLPQHIGIVIIHCNAASYHLSFGLAI